MLTRYDSFIVKDSVSTGINAIKVENDASARASDSIE